MKNRSNSLGLFSNFAHKLNDGDHLCKFYETETVLINAISDFIVPGITRNEGIVIIAVKEHIHSFQLALENRSIDVTKSIAKGQLILLDAHECLAKFMDEDLPNREKFRKLIGSLLTNMQKTFPKTRAYGEMVNILIEGGNKKGTIQLEELWNELSQDFGFSLLCGYSSKNFPDKSAEIFKTICTSHNHMIVGGKLEKIVETRTV